MRTCKSYILFLEGSTGIPSLDYQCLAWGQIPFLYVSKFGSTFVQ